MHTDYPQSGNRTGTGVPLGTEQAYYTVKNAPVIDSHRQGGSGQHKAAPGFLRRFGPLGLVLIFVFGKLKYLLLILKIGKFKTFITMLISIWAYAMFWGWSFAAGFVGLIFIHEMGHVLALRLQGVKSSAPMFIPFVGAFIAMKELPDNAFGEAIGAAGGPLLGTLGAIGCAGAGLVTGNPFWFALASSGFLLNLFNLLPMSPLDGGRIIGAISPRLWIFGLAGAIFLFYLTWSPILALVVIMGSVQMYNSYKKTEVEQARYYAITPKRRLLVAAIFLGLLVLTTVGMLAVQVPLDQFQQRAGISVAL
jgi:Zn-dependent protease